MIHYVKGNLLDSNCDYICHQVNCQGVMGSGIARQIRERWPEVYKDYYDHCNGWYAPGDDRSGRLLGSIDIVQLYNGPRKHVINMYSQQFCGYDGKRYTSYDAFAVALENIKYSVPADKSIGFPKNIGCGLGGGNWNVIITMIREILGKEYDVYIYDYDPEVK